ncbi:MAG: hypothetical protein QOJ26_1805 [Thermoplasmata archaeon]|jgi:hypothetical protein|nr:hypothetical protein [Thermoplasmata archaeon]MEA3166926.1 hypothetical protein [Thermoplasmata archaeon]
MTPLRLLAATTIDPRAVVADAALLLLVGGLVMLCLIMLLVGIQNIVPERAPPPGAVPTAREEPLKGLWPRRPRQVASGLPVDKAMARIVHLKLGEPRILQARLHTTRVRLYGCPGCSFEVPGAAAHPGCAGERGGVERAFKDVYGGRVSTWEIACRRRGDEACDFEVKH